MSRQAGADDGSSLSARTLGTTADPLGQGEVLTGISTAVDVAENIIELDAQQAKVARLLISPV